MVLIQSIDLVSEDKTILLDLYMLLNHEVDYFVCWIEIVCPLTCLPFGTASIQTINPCE